MEKNMQQKEKIYIRNRYKIETILDSGGFGITYLAEDTEFCQKVVLKKYCPLEDRKISYEKGKKDFLREARTLSALSDITAIVRVLDYFEERGDAYIVMEYVKGHSLRKYIENRIESMNFSQAWDFFLPIIDALEKMHEKNLIHRDINPDNIIVREDETLKLIDFGSAREYASDVTMTAIVKGGYAPPEQFGFLQTDIRTDIYSVGVLMNYMLTGAFPQEVKYNGKMKNVLNICLNLRPEKRYSSAENLKKAVLHNYSARNDLFLLPGFRGDNNLVKIIALLIYMFYIFSSIIIVYAASIGNNIPQTIFALCFCIFTMGVSMLVFGDYTFYLERIFGLSDKGFWSKNLVRLFLTLVSIILSLILCVVMYYITEIMLSA